MNEDEKKVIANQIVAELTVSVETIQTSSSESDSEVVWDLIWRSFARTELAIGIANFVFEENSLFTPLTVSSKRIKRKRIDITSNSLS